MFIVCLSEKYPAAKAAIEKYSPEQLQYFPCFELHSEILENGIKVRMTPEIEDLLSQGRNWEHSGGAVGVSKLQTLFQLYDTYLSIRANFVKLGLPQVFSMSFCFLFVLFI